MNRGFFEDNFGPHVNERAIKLQSALLSMCQQYLSDDDGVMHHSFMSAGEEALYLLEDLGIVENVGREQFKVKAYQAVTSSDEQGQGVDMDIDQDFYDAVFEDFNNRLNEYGQEIFLIPLSFTQANKLAMMAAMAAAETKAKQDNQATSPNSGDDGLG